MIELVVVRDLLGEPHQLVGGLGFGQRFDIFHAPAFATGLNSARDPNPAISSRPFAIDACTAGNCSDAACAALSAHSSTIHSPSGFSASSPTISAKLPGIASVP